MRECRVCVLAWSLSAQNQSILFPVELVHIICWISFYVLNIPHPWTFWPLSWFCFSLRSQWDYGSCAGLRTFQGGVVQAICCRLSKLVREAWVPVGGQHLLLSGESWCPGGPGGTGSGGSSQQEMSCGEGKGLPPSSLESWLCSLPAALV